MKNPMHYFPSSSLIRKLLAFAITIAGLTISGACLAEDHVASADTEVKYAWTEIGADNQAIVRAVSTASSCPMLLVDDTEVQMSLRAAAGTVAQRTTASAPVDSKPSTFTLATCEYRVPAIAASVKLGSRTLPVPKADPQRIVVLGDTGCRLKKADDAWQACDDPNAWPLPTIAVTAAALHPDLVLHVGDYHYRENKCPADIGGCQGSPWGYGWDAWEADFFQPASPLLSVAPWIVVRGNHEECGRAGQGWFRFLDTQAYDSKRSCDDPANDNLANYSSPYAVNIGNTTQIIVFDSSKAGKSALASSSPQFQQYLTQFQSVMQMAAKPGIHSIFVNHHPVLAFAPRAGKEPATGNKALQSVMQTLIPTAYFPVGVQTAIHGHVHDFQAVNFSSAHPATFVVGNGGDNLDVNFPDPLPTDAQPAPGAVVGQLAHTSTFGFMLMLKKTEGNWEYQAYDRNGKLMTTCQQDGSKIACDKTGYLIPN